MRLTEKEIKRACEGYTIVVRPCSKGGYNVFPVRVCDAQPTGWARHVDSKMGIPQAITSICRDLDKFMGQGGKMSSSGRMRNKSRRFEGH